MVKGKRGKRMFALTATGVLFLAVTSLVIEIMHLRRLGVKQRMMMEVLSSHQMEDFMDSDDTDSDLDSGNGSADATLNKNQSTPVRRQPKRRPVPVIKCPNYDPDGEYVKFNPDGSFTRAWVVSHRKEIAAARAKRRKAANRAKANEARRVAGRAKKGQPMAQSSQPKKKKPTMKKATKKKNNKPKPKKKPKGKPMGKPKKMSMQKGKKKMTTRPNLDLDA